MVPLSTIFYPLAVISIGGLYAAWHRACLARTHAPDHVLRERVAYMLWVAASRI